MIDNTSVKVERHTREEIVLLTYCPECHRDVNVVAMVKDNTKAVKHPCRYCGSLLQLPVGYGHTKVIRRGAKK